MYKISYSLSIALVLGLFVWIMPQGVSAAELYFKVVPNTTAGDSSIVLEARINPESKNINVVEGAVSLTGNIPDDLSVEINKDGSSFTIWPTEPSYDKAGKVIRFVGGTPGGILKESLIFRIRLFSENPGDINVSWVGVKTFLNDGRGTEESTSVKSLDLNLNTQDTESTPDKKSAEDVKTKSTFSGFYSSLNVTISLLLIIIFLIAIFYAYKKFSKN